MSSSLNSKSKTSMFSAIRSGDDERGMTMLPSWMLHRISTWAGVLPCACATDPIVALSNRFPTRCRPTGNPPQRGGHRLFGFGVCTTVFEVGVDVPNPTGMLISDGDRFAISQLHQLRGRIGRGEHPSLCLLSLNYRRARRRGSGWRRSRRRWMDSSSPISIWSSAARVMCRLKPVPRPITLRFPSLFDHLDLSLTARVFCDSRYEESPVMAYAPGSSGVARRFLNESYPRFDSEFGVGVCEVRLHGPV